MSILQTHFASARFLQLTKEVRSNSKKIYLIKRPRSILSIANVKSQKRLTTFCALRVQRMLNSSRCATLSSRSIRTSCFYRTRKPWSKLEPGVLGWDRVATKLAVSTSNSLKKRRYVRPGRHSSEVVCYATENTTQYFNQCNYAFCGNLHRIRRSRCDRGAGFSGDEIRSRAFT